MSITIKDDENCFILEAPSPEIFKVNAEYFDLSDKVKLEMIVVLKEWIKDEESILNK